MSNKPQSRIGQHVTPARIGLATWALASLSVAPYYLQAPVFDPLTYLMGLAPWLLEHPFRGLATIPFLIWWAGFIFRGP